MRPAWRSSEFPAGLPDLSENAAARVAEGNEHASFIGRVLAAAEKKRLLYWVENPYDSFQWAMPKVAGAMSAAGLLPPRSPLAKAYQDCDKPSFGRS